MTDYMNMKQTDWLENNKLFKGIKVGQNMSKLSKIKTNWIPNKKEMDEESDTFRTRSNYYRADRSAIDHRALEMDSFQPNSLKREISS